MTTANNQKNHFPFILSYVLHALLIFLVIHILDGIRTIEGHVHKHEMKRLQEGSKDCVTYPLKEPKAVTSTISLHEADKIHAVLKDFFEPSQQETFLKLLQGQEVAEKHIFLGQANQLADAFKQAYEAHLLPGYDKKDMISWIKKNFSYKVNSKDPKEFSQKFLHDCISSNTKPCKNPLINIDRNGDQLEITPLSRTDKKFEKT